MKCFVLPVLAFSVSLLAGCGGVDGCGGEITSQSNPRYAGSYTAIYTPTTGGGSPISFTFTLDANGQAQGTVTDAGGTPAKTVSGGAGDRRNGCNVDGISASFTLAGDGPGDDFLTASRRTRNSISGTYAAAIQGALSFNSGTLTITRAAG